MAEWREIALGQLGELFDGPHATPTRRDVGPYFLNISSLKNGRLDLADSDHVSEEEFDRWTRRVTPRAGDLLFSYETRLGEAALMPDGVRACLGRRMALLRPDVRKVDPAFLLYLYLGPAFQATIEQNTIHGATVNRIPLTSMGSWVVSLPDLAEQRAIAAVLGALDDKIAANTKLATTAAALSTEQYRTALAGGDLRSGRFFDFFSVDFGAPFKSEFFSDRGSGRPLIRIRDLKSFEPQVWTTESRDDELVIDGGDVVVGMDGDFTPTPWFGPPGLLNQRVCRVTTEYSRAFTLEAVRGPVRFIEGHKSGTTVIHLNKRDLEETKVVLPGDVAARGFDQATDGLLELQVALHQENRSLGSLRDALLPALMSGRLRVRNAEQFAEDPASAAEQLGEFRPTAPEPRNEGTLW